MDQAWGDHSSTKPLGAFAWSNLAKELQISAAAGANSKDAEWETSDATTVALSSAEEELQQLTRAFIYAVDTSKTNCFLSGVITRDIRVPEQSPEQSARDRAGIDGKTALELYLDSVALSRAG